jgi:hypothetical protein
MTRVLDAIYNSITQPSPSKPKAEPKPSLPSVTREGVDAILAHQRSGTPEQLQQILDREKEFRLISKQRDNIGLALSIAPAAKFRAAQGECDDVPRCSCGV